MPLEDAGYEIRSVGGGRFVGAPYSLCGGTGTSSSLRFWDLGGEPVEMPANPFPPTRSCAPCELDALISPDGELLAYRHRPDAFHHESPFYTGPPCGGGAEQVDAWWEGSKGINAEIAVIDLASGDLRWWTEVPAAAFLSDFDGRFVVVAEDGVSVIHDISGRVPPLEVIGGVCLAR